MNLPLRSVLMLSVWLALALPAANLATPQEPEAEQVPNQNDERRLPVFGKITVVSGGSFKVENPDGETVMVKLNASTEFRRDRQVAKRSDFKVGDLVIVRGEQNPDHSWTAQIVAGRSVNGSERGGRVYFQGQGTLGKDYVIGEVKSVDPPKITVLRTDKVTQTFELNEDTSLHKGRDAVTMADIQRGDHLFARGAMQNDEFVPNMVMVIGPEQWKRMQEMTGMRDGATGPNKPTKPPEPQN